MSGRMIQASESESKFPVAGIISHNIGVYLAKGATNDQLVSLGGLLSEIDPVDLEEIKNKSAEISRLVTEAIVAYTENLEKLLAKAIKIEGDIKKVRKAIEENPRLLLKVLRDISR